MNWATAVVIIVAIVMVSQVLRARYRAQADITRDYRGGEKFPAHEDEATRREIEELRERVKVLEQITVDGREAKAIADEIESLRDR